MTHPALGLHPAGALIDGGPVDGLTARGPDDNSLAVRPRAALQPLIENRHGRGTLSRVAEGDERSELVLDKVLRPCQASLKNGTITVKIRTGRVAQPFGFRPHRSGQAAFPHPALPEDIQSHARMIICRGL